ncbi:MAG: ATP-binding protein [Syntrophaceae bacterium]|nr:ATP-binding protein [Syntrophaceae bacterium]
MCKTRQDKTRQDKTQEQIANEFALTWSRVATDIHEKSLTSPDISTLSAEELQQFVHEFHIQNIALEMRNQELQESQNCYRTLCQNMLEGFAYCKILYDEDRRPCDWIYLDVNRAFERLSGLDNLVGEKVTEAIPGIKEAHPELFEIYGRVALTGQSEKFEIDFKPLDIFLNISVFSPAKDHFIAVFENVTDRKQAQKENEALQAQFIQAQKMEAIGTLAGGIYHDFNNLLQVIVGYSEILLQRKQLDESDDADLEQIYAAGKRGAELIQGLMTFSRKADIQTKPINLEVQIRQFKNILSRTIHKMIRIELIFDPDLALIKADPGQMEQVLMNLAVNARDAMGDKGKFTIGAKNTILDETYCNTHVGVQPGAYVLLTVSDTGTGMDKETLSHIFEPFFTTKQEGKGTGLGLATVYGIVKRHNGSIDCESEPGHGTTFKIYFPAISPNEKVSIDKTPVAPKSGMETILFVDDEEPVRIICSRMLKSVGYGVLTACNGKQALDLYKQEGGNISLVILDLLMPEMGGQKCLEEILKIDPKVKVIIASGLPLSNEQTKLVINSGAKACVHKPYDMKDMLKIVRKVVDDD